MTTTQSIEAARALLAAQEGSPAFDEADTKEISRLIQLTDSATVGQAETLYIYIDRYQAHAQARAYERVAVKLESWSASAAILGEAAKAIEYAQLAKSRRELAEAVRLVRL